MIADALASLAVTAPGAEGSLAASAPVRFCVPILDTDEFGALKVKRRSEVNITLAMLARVHELRGKPGYVCATDALGRAYRHLRGMAGVSLRAKYAAYVAGGCNWRSLVKGYVPRSQQPHVFTEFVRGLVEQNPRSIAEAIAKLRRLWAGGAEIPGYGSWREWFAATWPGLPVPVTFPGVYPDGWSVSNLRNYGPSRAERALFTRGYAAAHAHLPSLKRDPSKLRPLELVVIDDFQLDVLCAFRGDPERGLLPQIAYVAGLLAMDVASRKKLTWLLGPLVERDLRQPDGTTKKVTCNIRAVDVQVLLFQLFQTHGLPEYPVTILCENATASISPDLELMLGTIYEGRIRVQRTSLLNHRTQANGFVENGGTPWEKGWIEAEFAKLWNMFADQPGYKGSNERLNGPANLDAMRKYAGRFLGTGERKLNLPPEVIAELRLPFQDYDELERAFAAIVELSERRTQHRLLGFDTITEFRWPHPALPAPEGIDAHGTNDFRALALLAPEQMRQMLPVERKESPLERWERLSAAHPRARINETVLGLFLLTPKKAAWRNHAVSFAHEKQGYSYVDDDNVMRDLQEGTEVLIYVDLKNPAAALVSKLTGEALGVLRMFGPSPRGVDITDPAAMAEARARRAEIVNRVLAGVRARPLHQAADAQIVADRAHNERVVTTWQAASGQNVSSQVSALAAQHASAGARAKTTERTAAALQSADGFDAESLL